MTENWTRLIMKAVKKTPKSDENIGSGLSETTELMSKNYKNVNSQGEFSKKNERFQDKFFDAG